MTKRARRPERLTELLFGALTFNWTCEGACRKHDPAQLSVNLTGLLQSKPICPAGTWATSGAVELNQRGQTDVHVSSTTSTTTAAAAARSVSVCQTAKTTHELQEEETGNWIKQHLHWCVFPCSECNLNSLLQQEHVFEKNFHIEVSEEMRIFIKKIFWNTSPRSSYGRRRLNFFTNSSTQDPSDHKRQTKCLFLHRVDKTPTHTHQRSVRVFFSVLRW